MAGWKYPGERPPAPKSIISQKTRLDFHEGYTDTRDTKSGLWIEQSIHPMGEYAERGEN